MLQTRTVEPRTLELLKELIATNRTDEAIDHLLKLTDGSRWHNEVVQQSAKFQSYRKAARQGILSKEASTQDLNHVNHAVLQIIDEIFETEKPPINSRKNQWWKYVVALGVIAGILGGFAEFLNFINVFPNKATASITNTVTVLVHGSAGKNDIVLPSRGLVSLVYGDAIIPEQINNEGEATFKQIPASFFEPNAKVELRFKDPQGEPYKPAYPDSVYHLKPQEYIALEVVLQGMDQIEGRVKDFERGEPIDSVLVRIRGQGTYTNKFGEFTLDIPEDRQQAFITITASKNGYQTWEMSNVSTTNEQELMIPLKLKK